MRQQVREAMSDVEAPRSLSAPNPWLERPRVEREGATLAAPPGLISAITGSSSQASAAVTSAIGGSPSQQRLWPLLLLGGGVFIVGLVVVAVIWRLIDGTETAKSEPEPVRSAGSPPSGSAAAPSNPVAGPDLDRPAEPDLSVPANSGSGELASTPRIPTARQRPSQAPRVAPRAASSENPGLRPAPSVKPESPAPSARPPAENPFDKRF